MMMSVGERLFLLRVLPAKGTLVTAKAVDEARAGLGFSAEEVEHYAFTEPDEDGRIRWDHAEEETEIKLSALVKGMLFGVFDQLVEDEELPTAYAKLYEKMGYGEGV